MTQPQFLSSVEHIMNPHAPVISADATIANARAAIEANNGDPIAVVGPDGSFEGVLSFESLTMVDSPTAGPLATRARMTVSPHESAFSVVSRMLARRIDWVPVVRQGRFMGTISRACVMSAFGETYTA